MKGEGGNRIKIQLSSVAASRSSRDGIDSIWGRKGRLGRVWAGWMGKRGREKRTLGRSVEKNGTREDFPSRRLSPRSFAVFHLASRIYMFHPPRACMFRRDTRERTRDTRIWFTPRSMLVRSPVHVESRSLASLWHFSKNNMHGRERYTLEYFGNTIGKSARLVVYSVIYPVDFWPLKYLRRHLSGHWNS